MARCSQFSYKKVEQETSQLPTTKAEACFHVCHPASRSGSSPLAYLLLLGHKDLLGLLDHGLRLQLLLAEAVLARVEQLPPGYAGQDQVCGVGVVVDIYLDLIGVDGIGRHSVLRGGDL